MSSLADILTASKNIVTAINNAAQAYLNVNGIQTQIGIVVGTPALVKSGSGRIAYVSVTATSTTAGHIYDATDAAATTNELCQIPTIVGVFQINLPYVNGLVVAPGTGQTVTVSYS